MERKMNGDEEEQEGNVGRGRKELAGTRAGACAGWLSRWWLGSKNGREDWCGAVLLPSSFDSQRHSCSASWPMLSAFPTLSGSAKMLFFLFSSNATWILSLNFILSSARALFVALLCSRQKKVIQTGV